MKIDSAMILALAFQLIGQYKQARDAQAALDPRSGVVDDPGTVAREDFLSDRELAELLGQEAAALQERARLLLEKYRPEP